MAAIVKDVQRLHRLHQLIVDHPGQSGYWYALRIGVSPKNIAGVLATAELLGILLAEDDEGRLFPVWWHR